MRRILIIGPSWIGDTLMAQPLLRRLRETDPSASIDVLAPAWTLPLLRRMPEVTCSIASPFKHGELALRERWKLARDLKQRAYEQAVVLPNTFKSALPPFLARIPRRTGYVGELRQPLLNDARQLDETAHPMLAERYAALAQPADTPLKRPLPPPALTIDEAQRAALLARLELNGDRPIACLCPGAEYGPAKCWPASYYAELAQRLASQGFQIWIVGSAKDRATAAEIVRLCGGCAIDLCGRTSLDEAADLLSSARVVVSNDSGLMHVAAAVAAPVVALYGSTSPAFTPPLSAQARILKVDIACSPCYQRTCPLGHFRCMRELTPGTVLEAALNMAAPQTVYE